MRDPGNEVVSATDRIATILVPIALFSSLSRQGLGTRIDSRAEALPAKRWEKGYGDENALLRNRIYLCYDRLKSYARTFMLLKDIIFKASFKSLPGIHFK